MPVLGSVRGDRPRARRVLGLPDRGLEAVEVADGPARVDPPVGQDRDPAES
jgi:hypothetical protein